MLRALFVKLIAVEHVYKLVAESDQPQATRNKDQERRKGAKLSRTRECHQENQSRSAKAAMLRSESVSRKAGIGDKELVGLVEGRGEGEGEKESRTTRKGGWKRDGKGSTCVVTIIRMVGHSCNAGAHAIERRRRGRAGWWCAPRMPTMHSLYLSLAHYASTAALSRILKVGLARGQVGSRFCCSPYISPRDGPARVENQPIPPAIPSRLLRPSSWRSLLCGVDLSWFVVTR